MNPKGAEVKLGFAQDEAGAICEVSRPRLREPYPDLVIE
uniref:Uncharacterized protein n=1 Tax=Setaria digitata TaxID=48799 RepID=A0A915PIR3_9BILA